MESEDFFTHDARAGEGGERNHTHKNSPVKCILRRSCEMLSHSCSMTKTTAILKSWMNNKLNRTVEKLEIHRQANLKVQKIQKSPSSKHLGNKLKEYRKIILYCFKQRKISDSPLKLQSVAANLLPAIQKPVVLQTCHLS